MMRVLYGKINNPRHIKSDTKTWKETVHLVMVQIFVTK